MTLVQFTSVATTTDMPTEETLLNTNERISAKSDVRLGPNVATASALL
jgi:hypothetical protein